MSMKMKQYDLYVLFFLQFTICLFRVNDSDLLVLQLTLNL